MDICIEANRACLSRSSRSSLRRQASEAGGTCVQELTILLDGITAGDYLTWVRDPEPRALGRDLVAIATAADPVAARIDVHLIWGHTPPDPWIAARAAGFPRTPEVIAVLPAGSAWAYASPTGDSTGEIADASRHIRSDRPHRTL